MSKILTDTDYEEAVKNYKEQPYHQEGEVFVYDTPVECYYEVWIANHSSDFYILVPSDFDLGDTTIYAFSKNLKALEKYSEGAEGKKFSAFRW